MGCTSCSRCLKDTTRQFSKASAFILALCAASLVIFATTSVVALHGDISSLADFWFLIPCIIVGSIIAVLGITSHCSDTGLYLYFGASVMALPLEASIISLYIFDEAELRTWADEDPTNRLTHTLDWIDSHPQIAALLTSIILLLQILPLLLTAAFACCPTTPSKTRTTNSHWTDDSDLESPLLSSPYAPERGPPPPTTTNNNTSVSNSPYTPRTRHGPTDSVLTLSPTRPRSSRQSGAKGAGVQSFPVIVAN